MEIKHALLIQNSEDMQAGFIIEETVIVNPFKADCVICPSATDIVNIK